ncbi:Carbonate dehydratase [Bertholletia excelsa]
MASHLSQEAALANLDINDAEESNLESRMPMPPPPPSPDAGDSPIPPCPDACDSPIAQIGCGFLRFKENEFDKDPDYFSELAKEQKPRFLVFACSDSRVCPSRVLDFRPGVAFMGRSIANLVPGFNQLRYSGTGAIIEYAVATLGVEVILVTGHSRCGGIKALIDLPENGAVSTDFVHDWIKIGLPAKAKVMRENPNKAPDELYPILEREAVNLSLMNLLTYPYVRDKVAEKKLKLMGGYYDFVEGRFDAWGFELEMKPPVSFPPPADPPLPVLPPFPVLPPVLPPFPVLPPVLPPFPVVPPFPPL